MNIDGLEKSMIYLNIVLGCEMWQIYDDYYSSNSSKLLSLQYDYRAGSLLWMTSHTSTL